jgi:hypothetical protein
MTATTENSAPLGFQHLEQPHTWLNAVLPFRLTVTGEELHLQVSVPPAKSVAPDLTPLSTAGCIEIAMMFSSVRIVSVSVQHRAPSKAHSVLRR